MSMVHVLGVGSIGSLLAYHLKTQALCPVTLLLRQPRYARALQSNSGTITLETDGIQHTSPGCAIEFLAPLTESWRAKPQASAQQLLAASALTRPIETLVVATKAQHAASALGMLRHRLSAESTVVFVQNGYGTVDHVNQYVFGDVSKRPSYVVATSTHGAFRRAKRHQAGAVWSAKGDLAFAVLPSQSCQSAIRQSEQQQQKQRGKQSLDSALDSNPLLDLEATTQPSLAHIPMQHPATASLRSTLQSLLVCEALQPAWLPFPALRTKQLQKVVINVCVNSLTALLDVKNGRLLSSKHYRSLVAKVCGECEDVFRAQNLIPAGVLDHPLAAPSLYNRVIAVTESTAQNVSSTLADLRGLADGTEIDAMNGYFSDAGRALGVKTPNIDLLAQLVQMRLEMLHHHHQPAAPSRRSATHGHRNSRSKSKS